MDLTGSVREGVEPRLIERSKDCKDVPACESLAKKLSLFLEMIRGLVEGCSSVNGPHGTPSEPFILRLHLFEAVILEAKTAPGVGL